MIENWKAFKKNNNNVCWWNLKGYELPAKKPGYIIVLYARTENATPDLGYVTKCMHFKARFALFRITQQSSNNLRLGILVFWETYMKQFDCRLT